MSVIELYNRVYPYLMGLEKQRQKNVRLLCTVGFVVALVCLFLFWLLLHNLAVRGNGIFLSFSPVLVFSWWADHFVIKPYKRNYKRHVVNSVIAAIYPNLTYDANAKIPSSLYRASHLFPQGFDRYRGEDYVQGLVGKTQIQFSELHVEKRSYDSKNRRRYYTQFRGLYFVADFNKHFQHTTIVLPDATEKIFGRFASAFQKMGGMVDGRPGKLIKLEDHEFEKRFKVLATNDTEARYILSPSLMRRIMEFSKNGSRRISLGFVHSHVHIAIQGSHNRFEPKLFSSIVKPDIVSELVDDVQMVVGIVEDLNLNTRIWTKA